LVGCWGGGLCGVLWGGGERGIYGRRIKKGKRQQGVRIEQEKGRNIFQPRRETTTSNILRGEGEVGNLGKGELRSDGQSKTEREKERPSQVTAPIKNPLTTLTAENESMI